MARYDVGVVVLLEGAVAVEVDALRRALSDPDLDTIPAHVTLVPPVRVRGEELPAALAVVRAAARSAAAFTVALEPPATFAPVSPTVHLPVLDPHGRLAALRAAVFRAPLARDTHAFVAHVTLLANADPDRIAAALDLLGGYRAPLPVGRLTVLVKRRHPEMASRWEPAADVELDGVRTVGGGGPLALELATGTLVDPETAAWLAAVAPEQGPVGPDGLAGPSGLVVTARRQGAVVGLALDTVDAPEPARRPAPWVFVDPAARRQGIGSHLRREWAFRVQRRRASAAVVSR